MGRIEDQEMMRVFNMGVGMVLVVPDKEEGDILDRLEKLGEKAYRIGVIEKRDDDQPFVSLV
ncbi:MAG: AIR synthase-related protein [Smithellaceae bacterium]|nr:AIR synthase-related protein [Smithellaceae bacterium]